MRFHATVTQRVTVPIRGDPHRDDCAQVSMYNGGIGTSARSKKLGCEYAVACLRAWRTFYQHHAPCHAPRHTNVRAACGVRTSAGMNGDPSAVETRCAPSPAGDAEQGHDCAPADWSNWAAAVAVPPSRSGRRAAGRFHRPMSPCAFYISSTRIRGNSARRFRGELSALRMGMIRSADAGDAPPRRIAR